jgi:hypothetical protein
MPIHERLFFAPKVAQATIAEDRPCQRCSYNLVGLKIGARCPECGTPITGPGAARFVSTMADAPVPYLERLRSGAAIMGVGGAALLLTFAILIVALAVRGPVMIPPLLVMLASVVWLVGVWIVTEPCQDGTKEGLSGKGAWAWSRVGSRVTQAAWVLSMLLIFVAGAIHSQGQAAFAAQVAANPGAFPLSATAPITAFVRWCGAFGTLSAFVAIAGLAVLAIHLARMADWAHDSALAARLRMAPLLVVIAAPLGIIALVAIPFLRAGITGFLAVPIGGLSAMIFLGCVGVCIFAFAQFVSLCAWSHTTALTRINRDSRLSDRISRRIESAQAHDAQAYVPPVWAKEAQQASGARGNFIPASGESQTFDLAPDEPRS